ncbi:hypothetical protein D3C78_1630310 [compost metagenome]
MLQALDLLGREDRLAAWPLGGDVGQIRHLHVVEALRVLRQTGDARPDLDAFHEVPVAVARHHRDMLAGDLLRAGQHG